MNHRTVWSAFAIVTIAAASCAESETTGTGGASSSTRSSTTGVTTATGTGSATQDTSTTAGATASASSGGGPGGVTINELSGAGDDYIELFNAGTTSVDLSGLRVADQDTPGVPKLTSAVTLPTGTSLPPGAYLFILLGQATAETTPQTMCAPGPAPCFWGTYKLSNKSGDAGFLIDKDGTVLQAVTYPGNLDTGHTWSRLPNGTGDFADGVSTPGAANQAQ